MHPAISSGESGSNTSPASPTCSGIAYLLATITGQPAAIASKGGIFVGPKYEGITIAIACLYK